jgi:hypothetical protein
MDELARVIIVGLAGWRVAALLSYEEGPWGVFEQLRRRAGVVEIDLGAPPDAPAPLPGFFGKLLSCVWCTSVWLSLIFWGLWEVHWYVPGIAAAAAIVVVTEQRLR